MEIARRLVTNLRQTCPRVVNRQHIEFARPAFLGQIPSDIQNLLIPRRQREIPKQSNRPNHTRVMSTPYWGPFTRQPNLLIFITDQQRTAQYLPAGWVQNNLPNLAKLMAGGVTFVNGMTNTTACSPARATLWTSSFPMRNGVQNVGQTLDMKAHPNLTTLGLALTQYAPAGITYDVVYKGKWHLNTGFESGQTLADQQASAGRAQQTTDNATMQQTYGFAGWTSQDFGTAMDMDLSSWSSSQATTIPANVINTMGGGLGGNDQRVATGTSFVTQTSSNPNGEVAGAKAWLCARAKGTSNPNNPFCLVVSLLNPHDVFASPSAYVSAGYLPIASGPNAGKYPWQIAPFTEIDTLPASYDLTAAQLATKPGIQNAYRWTPASGSDQIAQRAAAALDYIRFYAYLETLTDALLGEVLAEMTDELTQNTLIVRLSDHGEMGLSQGGMVEKEHQAYNETLLVPIVFSHPALPQGEVCTGLAGLIDMVPTLAEVCGLTIPASILIQGQSIATAILQGASGRTYTQLQFESDDASAVIRGLIDNSAYNMKYVVSTSSSGAPQWQCELYDFSYDPSASDPWPSEITNLIPVNGLQGSGSYASSASIQAIWSAMHTALTCAMSAAQTTPSNWPPAPPATIPGQNK